jgi:hypothetical protein
LVDAQPGERCHAGDRRDAGRSSEISIGGIRPYRDGDRGGGTRDNIALCIRNHHLDCGCDYLADCSAIWLHRKQKFGR